MTGRRVVVVVMLVALSACRRESANITGSYGGGVLSGAVILNDIEGSPEGVEVSVRNTGMVTILGGDGQFAFASVPENAILDFRRSDGIRASLRLTVDGGEGSMLIELGRSKAAKSSGRRNNGRDKRQFEGVIRSAGADSIVLYTSHKEEVSIGLADDTVIRWGNEILTAGDLVAEMRVHVRARKVTEGFVAQEIAVQGDGGGEKRPAVKQYEGTIVRASATELVINDSHRNEVAFAMTAETIIRKGNVTVVPADLQAGQRVHVKAVVAADGAATAVEVTLQKKK